MSILCHRHTTSKLVDFSDLQQLQTLGFRGEALASISFVSHLSVITRTKEDQHAWKASYKSGVMEPGSPIPSAGTQGTTVTVDDLFYNVPMRRKVRCAIVKSFILLCVLSNRSQVNKRGNGIYSSGFIPLVICRVLDQQTRNTTALSSSSVSMRYITQV